MPTPKCTHCGKTFSVDPSFAEGEVTCPACKAPQKLKTPARPTGELYKLADETPAPRPPVAAAPDPAHAAIPAELGEAARAARRPRQPRPVAKKPPKRSLVWLAGIAVLLAVAVGGLAYVAWQNSQTPEDQAASADGNAEQASLVSSDADGQAPVAAAGTGGGGNTGEVPAAGPGKWDGFNGMLWGTHKAAFTDLEPAQGINTVFDSNVEWYTRRDDIDRFADAYVTDLVYAFRGERLCEVQLISTAPEAVQAWVEETYGPSNAQAIFEGVTRWKGEDSHGRTVVIECCEGTRQFPASLRMAAQK
jgi:hypothetical protein